ncbi:TIGR00266 family protein [Pseudomonas cuatrocienegasensis]|uniref:TIGR00266 family protein n=1 Tax=Pseudomonas cuatrocienegasensis TaxID=543360 RepID=A0ABY1B5J6_9PSED|nr:MULTISPECIES: TIGR00266 family protein [Pseudomonas]OEC37404.1 TIGR00266 family protein [Pseudomonas sp. 21C1]SEP95518.1 TIGR00266 family protein [Pseudomonas cuatrocienegasensis]
MPSHQLDYEILGASAQSIEIILDPGETVIAEAGAMNYMTDGIRFETRMGDGSASGVLGKLWGVGKRMLTGESLFMTHFSNAGKTPARVAFAAPYPGTVVPIALSEIGGTLICQKDAFLCAAYGTSVGISFNKRLGAGFFGGEGFILQKLQGDGLAFVHAGGTVIRKQLNNETLRLDTGCLVGFTAGIDYDIALSGGLRSMLFGGEGIVLATLKGSGTVWIQSLPFSRLAARVYESTFKAREEVRAGGK